MVSLLQRVPFSNAGVPAQQKGTKRLCPGVRHFAEAQCSLATVSIRGHRLRFASLHLLSMYAASPHGAARPPPDGHLRSACRRGWRSKARARAKADQKITAFGSSDRGLGVFSLGFGRLSGRRLREQARSHRGMGCGQLETGRLAGRHRQQAGSYNWMECIQLEIVRL